jgi:serine/threonine protein kinase
MKFEAKLVEYSNLVPEGVLGKGSYGVVQLVRDSSTGDVYALKRVGKKQGMRICVCLYAFLSFMNVCVCVSLYKVYTHTRVRITHVHTHTQSLRPRNRDT